MKRITFSLLLLLLLTQMYGQKADSLLVVKKLTYKSFIAPTALLATGAVLLNSELNGDIQTKSGKVFGTSFRSGADNIFPFVPIAQIYLGKTLGFEPKTNYRNQTMNILVANTATVVVVEIAKRIAKRERPDMSDNMSFPSGHSAVAFTNATLLYYEYKNSNFWYASSGFVFAATTGAFRIANNKHYASDVLAGAGIGMISGIVFSNLTTVHSFKIAKKSKTTAFVYPQVGNQIGLGAIINPNF
jgi:membrane-associated phospholipid phosphatase